MAIKKSQLYSTLWESCNALRGSMDASQYKDYVQMILFVKYLSDKVRKGQMELDVPDGCYFEDFVALKQNPHIGEKINEKLEAIREANTAFIGGLTLPNFNDDTKLGSGKTKVETLSKLIGEFQRDELDFSLNRAADDDLLGDAYEYLMKNFAAESGKSKGQFYTPAEVSRVMAKVIHMEDFNRANHTIYDMTCGSGSLLLRALSETPNGQPTLYGQEKDATTASLAKLNMLLHGVVSAEIKVGDTLGDPQFITGSMLDTFDVCVANPPFSRKNWMPSNGESDLYRRWNSNLLPPAKCGDFAFLLHLIASMKSDTGRGACILPHGVLFRGNAEYNIRRQIVEHHYLKGIIGLPPNLFYGTGIPACILILDKRDTAHSEGIFFIDAKDGFMKDGNKNRLREQDIKRIVDVWNEQQAVPHYARMVRWEEIESNDYNLNIPRYIQPKDTEIQHDIEAHLHGGLPAHDVDGMQEYWNVCPSLKESLFKSEADGYYGLKPAKADIAQSVENDPSYISQSERFYALLNEWKVEIMPQMKAINKGVRPKGLITKWSDLLLDKTVGHSGLVDAYDVYDVMLNYWADVMQDDCYMIANEGWTFPEVRAFKKNTKGKDTACAYDEIVCDLIPVSLVLEEYFQTETSEISDLQSQVKQKQQTMDYLVEQNMEVFTFDDDDDTEDNKSIVVRTADVKKAVKKAKTNSTSDEELTILQQWLDLSAEKDDLNKTLKQKSVELTGLVVTKYATLTEDEIKMLVVERKWLASILGECEALMQNVTHKISSEVTALVERYKDTLSELARSVADYEHEVNGYLKEMGFSL